MSDFASATLSGSQERELFDHLRDVISSKWFLEKQGLNNEVPFFICPFKPEYQIQMTRVINQLSQKLDGDGVSVLETNLFDIALELLEKRNLLSKSIERETDLKKDQLVKAFRNVLDPQDHLIPKIREMADEANFDVLFITGVGEVFPFIRSHNVLNNLQSAIKVQPTVMFFPGSYQHELATGASLDLFGLLTDDKYYRAYNILTYKVPA